MFSLLVAFAFSGLKSAGSAIIKWLCHRSFWQLVVIGLAVLILVQHFQIAGEKRHSAKVESQLAKATLQLKRLSAPHDAQGATTRGAIKAAEQKIKTVQIVKERIINTPNPGNCSTPALEESRNAL